MLSCSSFRRCTIDTKLGMQSFNPCQFPSPPSSHGRDLSPPSASPTLKLGGHSQAEADMSLGASMAPPSKDNSAYS